MEKLFVILQQDEQGSFFPVGQFIGTEAECLELLKKQSAEVDVPCKATYRSDGKDFEVLP